MIAPAFTAPGAPTEVIIHEMQYASGLLLRADAAISQEFDVLRAGGVVIDWNATQRLSAHLVRMAAQLHMLALDCAALRGAA
jgi:hypothetical protein